MSNAQETLKIARRTMVAAWVAIGISLVAPGWTIYHDIWKDKHPDKTLEAKVGAIEGALLILTKASAPQVYDAVRDIVKISLNQSPEMRDKSLEAAKAGITELQRAKVPADPEQILPTENELKTVLSRSPNSIPGWQLASELISYRSTSTRLSIFTPNNCFARDNRTFTPGLNSYVPMPAEVVVVFTFRHCILNLDSMDDLTTSLGYELIAKELADHHPVILRFSEAKVVYNGGPIHWDGGLLFENCQFVLRQETLPPDGRTRRLFAGILGNSSNSISVELT